MTAPRPRHRRHRRRAARPARAARPTRATRPIRATRPARATRPTLAALAALAAVLVVLGLAPASAAGLTLSAHPLTTVTAAACTSGSLSARPSGASGGTARAVTVSGVPAACRGRSAVVRLYRADGTPLATADTAVTLAAADTTTVTVPSYATAQAAGIAVAVEGWGLATTWAVTPSTQSGPVTPGPGTTFDSLTWTFREASGKQACFTAQLSGTPGTTWRVDLHVGMRPFNGVASADGFVASPWDGRFLSRTPVDGVLSFVGGSGSGTFGANQPVEVTICHWSLPAPAYDPALTYTVSSGAPSGDAYYACSDVTVRVSGSPRFFAGWRADVDVRPLLDFVTARGGSAAGARFSFPGNHAAAPLGGTLWRVEPTGWDTYGVRDDVPQVFRVCVTT